jgi:hypothetical protein
MAMATKRARAMRASNSDGDSKNVGDGNGHEGGR